MSWLWVVGIAIVIYMVVIPMYRGRKRARLEDLQVSVLAKIMEHPAPQPGHMYGTVHDERVKLTNLLLRENMGAEPQGTFRKELELIAKNCTDKSLIEEFISYYDKGRLPNVGWNSKIETTIPAKPTSPFTSDSETKQSQATKKPLDLNDPYAQNDSEDVTNKELFEMMLETIDPTYLQSQIKPRPRTYINQPDVELKFIHMSINNAREHNALSDSEYLTELENLLYELSFRDPSETETFRKVIAFDIQFFKYQKNH